MLAARAVRLELTTLVMTPGHTVPFRVASYAADVMFISRFFVFHVELYVFV